MDAWIALVITHWHGNDRVCFPLKTEKKKKFCLICWCSFWIQHTNFAVILAFSVGCAKNLILKFGTSAYTFVHA